jgi:hypothetical protein
MRYQHTFVNFNEQVEHSDRFSDCRLRVKRARLPAFTNSCEEAEVEMQMEKIGVGPETGCEHFSAIEIYMQMLVLALLFAFRHVRYTSRCC